MEPPKIEIQNLVYTSFVSCVLNLADVNYRLRQIGMAPEFNPKKFAAVILRLKSRTDPRFGFEDEDDWIVFKYRYYSLFGAGKSGNKFWHPSKIAVLLFSSGKIVCTGARFGSQARVAIRQAAENLREIGYADAKIESFNVENIVANAFVTGIMDLKHLASKYSDFCSYEKKVFPGAIFRHPTISPITALVFQSGKIVLTGGKDPETVQKAFETIFPLIASCLEVKEVVQQDSDIVMTYIEKDCNEMQKEDDDAGDEEEEELMRGHVLHDGVILGTWAQDILTSLQE